MTSLISWLGVDSRYPSSIYLASDSRISWGQNQAWDLGCKLYSPKIKPHLFGYCGDVLFPTQILPVLCELIDRQTSFCEDVSFDKRLDEVTSFISAGISDYPIAKLADFQVLYVSRIGAARTAVFHAALICFRQKSGLDCKPLKLPLKSGLIEGLGSGQTSVLDWYGRWQNSDAKGTSRSVFGAFCDSLLSSEDARSGGAPQLIGLYPSGPPKTFGIIWCGRKYFKGVHIPHDAGIDDVEWRNEKFECCSPMTMTVIEDAQKQPRPSNVDR